MSQESIADDLCSREFEIEKVKTRAAISYALCRGCFKLLYLGSLLCHVSHTLLC